MPVTKENYDNQINILKNEDIALTTRSAMSNLFFPVIMWMWDWTISKALRVDVFELCWRNSWTARSAIPSKSAWIAMKNEYWSTNHASTLIRNRPRGKRPDEKSEEGRGDRWRTFDGIIGWVNWFSSSLLVIDRSWRSAIPRGFEVRIADGTELVNTKNET